MLLVRLYVEPANDFDMLISKVSQLFPCSSGSVLHFRLSSTGVFIKLVLMEKRVDLFTAILAQPT